MLNTYPSNPFPPSTEQMHKGDNEDLQAQINAIKDGTDIDSFGDVESALGAKTDLEVIAPEFDAEAGTYDIGDLVTYQGKLYEFTSAHETAGDWDSTEVAEKTVADEIDTVKSGLIANRAAIDNDGSGINLLDIGSSLSDWGASGSNGEKIISFDISTRVTASIDASLGKIQITNYNTDGYVWMAKFVKLKKNTYYKSPITLANTLKIMGCNSTGPHTTGTKVSIDGEKTFNSGNYDYWYIAIYPGTYVNNPITGLMLNPSYVDNSIYTPYVPSVENRIEDLESGLTNLIKLRISDPINQAITANTSGTINITFSDAAPQGKNPVLRSFLRTDDGGYNIAITTPVGKNYITYQSFGSAPTLTGYVYELWV